MSVHNADIAAIFEKVADLLEIKGENRFRIRAYRESARIIGGYAEDIAGLVKNGGDLTELPGVGEDLAGKIATIVNTGRLPMLDDLAREIPPELADLMKIEGLGGKRVRALHDKLRIRGMDDLKAAAEDGRIRSLSGFGKKTERNILEGIEHMRVGAGRAPYAEAEQIAEPLVNFLRQIDGVRNVVAAGSYRRRRETVGDLDILVTCAGKTDVMERFTSYEDVVKVVSRGGTRSTVRLRSGFQVDLRLIADESYGAALHYFTGSKAHNIAVRSRGVERGLKINEYGVFRGRKRVAGRTEEEVFASVGLPYIEPELRENRGEIPAAREGRLPRLVTVDDIRGDLHMHTKLTDGRYTLEEMVNAARDLGREYIAITEHTKKVVIARGLNEEAVLRRIREIDRFNERLGGTITILKGMEIDILSDGSLDLPDRVLRELDVTVCSVHSKFNLPRSQQTERIIRAMDNPYFNILAHPSGRLINEREPYDVDFERLVEAARERGCFLELNSSPARLDLTDVNCLLAKDRGVLVVISTDAHSVSDLNNIRFGVNQARRGWLEAKDVLNTRTLRELKELLAARRPVPAGV